MKTKAAFLAGIAMLVLSSTASAAFPGKNGRIFYSLFQPDRNSIFSIAPDGTDRKKVPVQTDRDLFTPSVAPDGTIAFVGAGPNGYGQIYTSNQDGSGLRQLTHGSGNSFPSFCGPSGGRIVWRGPQGRIEVMRRDGSHKKRVTNAVHGPFHYAIPACSPNGTKVAFTNKKNGRAGIFTIRLSGENRKRLTHSTRGVNYGSVMDFSPSGKLLAFTQTRERPPSAGLFVMRANGTHRHRLTRNYGGAPAFSPNGKELVFVGGPEGNRMFTMRRDGSHIHRLHLTSNIPYGAPDWAIRTR